MPDDTTRANPWAAVRAFRAAAVQLREPAPGLLAAASLPEALVAGLMPALPLVDFSPFAELALPQAEVGREPDGASGSGPKRGLSPQPGLRPAPGPVLRSTPLQTASRGPGRPAGAATALPSPPVLPLGQGRKPVAGSTHPAGRQSDLASGGQSSLDSEPGASAAPARSVTGAAGPSPIRSRGGAAESSPSLSRAVPGHDLVEGIPARARPDTGAGTDGGSRQFAPRAVDETGPVGPLSQPREGGAGQILTALAAIDALADDLLAAPGKPARGPVQPPMSAAAAFETQPFRESGRTQSGPQTLASLAEPSALPTPAHEHQDQVLWSPASERIAQRSDRPEAAAEHAGRSAPAWQPSRDELGSEPQPFDADTLAQLVNEALADQARRHGVDLS